MRGQDQGTQTKVRDEGMKDEKVEGERKEGTFKGEKRADWKWRTKHLERRKAGKGQRERRGGGIQDKGQQQRNERKRKGNER